MFAVNDPYSGGTHLPDITLVSPVTVEDELLAYAVTRAHHSDVGGMEPGLPAVRLARHLAGGDRHPAGAPRGRGRGGRGRLALILANVRTPVLRRGDLRAQIAANRLAEARMRELVERRGIDVLRRPSTR